MKRFLIVSVLVVAVGAVLLELIRNDSGYVMIAIGTTTIEMSFWVGVALLLGTLVALWLLVFVIKRLYQLFTGGLGLAAKRSRKVEERTASGLIYFIENNWRAAKKDLLKASRHAQNPLVHYLAAARCSYELGEREETHKLLHKAEKIAPANELAVVLSQARIQLLDKKYEQCLATLKRARALSPQHPTVLDLLREVYWQLRDWQSLEALLPELRKQKLYKEEEQLLLEQNVYMALLSAAGKPVAKTVVVDHTEKQTNALARHDSTPVDESRVRHEPEVEHEKVLSSVWQRVPKNIKARAPVVRLYARLLLDAGLAQPAEKLIRQRLSDQWDRDLILLYGLVGEGVSARSQLTTAEKWHSQRPQDADLLLTLGRICLRNQLWGQARDYFESSLAISPLPETYAELARLLAYLGEHEKSTDLYQQGLLTQTRGLPALPMPGTNRLTQLGSEEDPQQQHVDVGLGHSETASESWTVKSGG